jgi:hypothetical protein
MPMPMQQAVELLRAKAKEARGVREMPEMDLTATRQMPEMDLTEPKEPRPGYDEAVATAGDVPDDVVQPVGEPVIKAPQVAAGESSGALGALRSVESASPPDVHMSENPAVRMHLPVSGGPLEGGQRLGVPPTSTPASTASLDEAIQATRRNRGLATIGEAISARTNRPRHLLDFAISKAGGRPEPMAQDPFTAQAQTSADEPLKQYTAQQQLERLRGIDSLNARKGESEITKNIAEAGKADREPGPKAPGAPHEPLFDPMAFKASKKADPVFMKEFAKQFNGDRKKAEAAIDALPNDKAGLESLDRNVAGQGKALTSISVTNQNDINKIPIRGAASVAEATTKDVIKERRSIDIAKATLGELRDAWHQVTPAELAAYKAFGVKTGALSRFDSLALASIDKTAAVESNGAARQGGINQWKETIKNGNYTNDAMDGALGGLDTALGIAEKENEGSLQGLPDVGGRKAPPPTGPGNTVRMKFPSGAVHQVPAEDVEEAKREHGAVEVSGG